MGNVVRSLPWLPDGYPVNWPVPEKGQSFADVLDAMPKMRDAWAADARQQLERLRSMAPDYLNLDEKLRAAELIEWMLTLYPASTPAELLWILAADAFRPVGKGRTSKWSGVEGRDLFELVEAGLRAKHLKRDSKKGLRVVIAEIRARRPELYGKYSEDRLRKAYYQARRGQSGKTAI